MSLPTLRCLADDEGKEAEKWKQIWAQKAQEPRQSQEESQKKSKCFIATAAYGSPLAAEVVILSRFRDDILLSSKLGALFVKFYYCASPPLASFIARVDFLRAVTRRLLAPILRLLRATKFGV